MSLVALPALFIVGAVSQYIGASLGVGLFDELTPAAVAWLRGAGAGLILIALLRPRRADWSARSAAIVAAFGAVTILMNIAFYESIARIDLGTAVALEFLGPIAVAVAGSRQVIHYLAAVLASLGVVCVAGVNLGGVAGVEGIVGVACALIAACLWAGYIVLGKRVADAGKGITGLGVGLAAGAVVLAVPALGFDVVTAPQAFASWRVIIVGLCLGLLSSVIPYALDQVVFARIDRERFALLLALLPVTAAIVGFVMLGQIPSWVEAAGIGFVMVAIGLTARDGPRSPGSAVPLDSHNA